jgi:dTDP-4-dehydrorhamnose reductase
MSAITAKILVVGGDSFIGKRLCERLLNWDKVQVFSVTRDTNLDRHSTILKNFDLTTNPSNKYNYLIKNYTSIIFLSGITNTKYIMNNYQYAKEINVKQTIKWIEFLAQNGTPVIFPSSSLVYEQAYLATEESPTLPNSAYGKMKLEVETSLKQSNLSVIKPRFTKIVGVDQPLIQKWIGSLRRKEKIRAYFDCQISPLPINQAVDVLIHLALDSKFHNSGPINISGARDISFFHFAKILAKSLGLNSDLVIPTDSREKGEGLMSKQLFATLSTFKASQLFDFYPQTPEQVVESLRSEIERFEI